MPRSLEFTLLGTGSSGGVPRVGNDWGACDPAEPRNRRSRCCALVDVYDDATPEEKTRLLIDASPDLREQLLSAEVDHLDGLVFTHHHADQCHGIDDVRALVIRMRRTLPTYMDKPTADVLTKRFDYCFKGRQGYPPILDLQAEIAPLQPFAATGKGGTVALLPIDEEHGPIRCLGFRIGSLGYCNDVSGLPEESLQALEGIDTFVVDALRYTPHPTHAHLDLVLEWVERLKPSQTILTNLHVDMDYQTLCRELPAGVVPGYDGMSIKVPLE